jgi:broad specificity phosphatase PhoE
MQLLKNNSLIYLLTGLIFLIGHPMTLPAEEPASTFNGLDVYITRHAETMGNVTGHYSEENQCTFSEKGKQQIAALPEKLNGYDFDLILVSPTYRTQHTILPYLMANNRTGLIFQAIEEIDCDAGPVQPSAEITQGKPVEIIPEGKKHLQLFDPAFTRRYDPENPAQVAAQIQGARDWILAHYGNSGNSGPTGNSTCSSITMNPAQPISNGAWANPVSSTGPAKPCLLNCSLNFLPRCPGMIIISNVP